MPTNITVVCSREIFTDAAPHRKSQFTPARFTIRAAAYVVAALSMTSLAALGAPNAEKRADALLSQMSLDEKIGQMVQVDLGAISKAKTDIQKYFIGSALSGGDSDPKDNTPQSWLDAVEELEAQALTTRLKIPLIYGVDTVHGHNNVLGAVIFPHNVGMGATRDAALVEKEGRITALEMLGTGIRWGFAPCVAVARDERWGRTYESYGESPELANELGEAEVRGFQGKHYPYKTSVLASAKHFLGDGGTKGGVDQGDVQCDEATLRRLYLTPYLGSIKAGVGSIMVSYSSWNGQKMSGNKHLLTDVLKDELGFKGFLVSDWAAIDQLDHDYKKDVEMSVNAGMDMVMIPHGGSDTNTYIDFITDLKQLVAEGRVSQARIDDAVRRILIVKYEMGLFEHPFTEHKLLAEIGSPKHREVARQCVRESMVLLKNRDHVLPLPKKIKHVCLVGQGADDMGMQCGGWTIDWQGRDGEVTPGGTTILAGVRKTLGAEVEVTYSKDGSDTKGADAIIAVVGEMPYAEFKGDRQDMQLDAGDVALVKKAKATGVPVVTVILSGRPMILGETLDASDGVIAAWLPGTEGQGVADVLFGEYKPTGKLSRTWPRNNDQLAADSIPAGETPQFPYGFGLSY